MADVANYFIENASGANVRIDLNAVFEAIQSSNSKTTDLAASQCVAGMIFLNSSTNELKVRNSANNNFSKIGNINQDHLGLLPRSGGSTFPMEGQFLADDSNSATNPAISFATNSNLGIFRKSANIMGFASNGTEQMVFDANGITLRAQNEIRFGDSDSSHYIGLKADPTIGTSFTLTLPDTDTPVPGYALISNGSGALSWGVAGGAVNGVFWENNQTITSNYTISNGKNAGSFGPITIQSGVTVTVGSGETWTVV